MSVLVIFTKLIWLLIMLSRIACLVDLSLALNRHRTDHSLECTACTDGHLLGVLSVQTCSPER
jgi:hypothetical protein